MKKLISLLFLAFAVGVKADTIQDIITITNAPTNGYTITVNGSVYTWTNTVTLPSSQIANTNTLAAATSNLFNTLAGSLSRIPGVSLYTNTTNSLRLLGNGLSVSTSTNWATNVFSTNASSTGYPLTLPIEVLPIAQRTNLASLTVTAVNNYATNALDQTKPVTGQLVGLANAQTVSGAKKFTNALNEYNGGTFTNSSLTNASLYGTNSLNTNLDVDNSDIILFQFGKDTFGDWGGVPLRFQWNSSQQYLEFNTGTLGTTTVPLKAKFVGVGTFLTDLDAGNLTTGNISTNRFNGATDATPFTFWRGDGVWSGLTGTGTNLTLVGTNTLNGQILIPQYANNSLANGNNAAVSIGTNSYVKVSGPSAAFSINGIAGGAAGRVVLLQNSTGQAMTLANDSGVDPTAANRIYTGSGADISITNNPAMVRMIYDGTLNRWALVSINGSQAVGGSGSFTGLFTGIFTGDGNGITALNGANIATGPISDSVLSGNVALLDGTLPFTGAVSINAAANQIFTANDTSATGSTYAYIYNSSYNSGVLFGIDATSSFLQYTGSATNLQIQQSGGSPGDIAGNAITFTTGKIGSLIVGNPTNTPSFTLVNTNWISGQLYTNLTGRPIDVRGNVILTTAGVAGFSQMALRVSSVVTNYSSALSAVAGLTGSTTNGIAPAFVPNGGVFTWTNTSSGAGDTSTTYGGQYMTY